MTVPPTIEVLLATYNGARFLREQIESILSQDYQALCILAADDGSQDDTPAILAEYAERFPKRLRVLGGAAPTGSAKANFLRLMHHASEAYVCFSDQDDVWLPSKVKLSLETMQALEQRHSAQAPLLVFTDLRVVDQHLQTLHPSMWALAGIEPENAKRLQRLLAQSIVTGCTMMINRPLLELARQMQPQATMHDRWIGLLAASMGATAFVREPQVLYRQHDSNVVGATIRDNSLQGLWRRLTNNDKRLQLRLAQESQVEALRRQHWKEMSTVNTVLLDRYLESSRSANSFNRIWMTLRHGFIRQGLLANLALLLEPLRNKRESARSKQQP